MKKLRSPGINLLFIPGFLMFWIAGCTAAGPDIDQPVDDVQSLIQLMPDPPPMFRPAPFWDWNDKITRNGIIYQLEQFQKAGMGGVFVHPRPGLITEYLSDEWFNLFNFTVEKAKELGMKVWIYDENSYPSGFAGGHVQAEMPDSYEHGTGLIIELTDRFTPDPEKELFKVLEKKDGKWIPIEDFQGTDPEIRDSVCLVYKTYGQKSYWFGNFPYVDLIHPGVTEKFIELTYEKGYQKYSGENFGKTIPGAFTDEPNLSAALDRESDIRWTQDLFEQFETRWGYSLEENLPSLVSEEGDWKKVRHDYHILLFELFIERWAKPNFIYMEDHDLLWTGHYWEHGWPYPSEGIDEMATYFWHQMPGIDMLGRSYDPEGQDAQFGNIRAVKELASAANQAGARRTLSETWGGGGYAITFKELKHLLDWEVVMGVNFVNPHLSYYSMQGVRKFDYPPTFSYHEPWWDHFTQLGDYTGRICLGTSAGYQRNTVLLLQPNLPAAMYYTRNTDYEEIKEIGTATKSLILNLSAAHVEFDLGSETVMKERASVEKNLLQIGNQAYKTIIIPPFFESIEKSTLGLLEEFLAGGGTVYSFTRSIPRTDGIISSEADNLAGKYAGRWIMINSFSDQGFLDEILPEDFRLTESDPATGQLFHQRRELDDGEMLFFVNSDPDEEVTAIIETPGKHLYLFDLNSGICYSIKAGQRNDRLEFNLHLPPGGSAMYLVSDRKIRNLSQGDLSEVETSDVPPADEIHVNFAEPNILTLDYVSLETWKSSLDNVYYMNAMVRLYEDAELPTGNPWQHKIQYKKDYLDLDVFDSSTAFSVEYQFTTDETFPVEKMKQLQAVIERPGIWSVSINSQPVTPVEGQWWTDKYFPVFAIGLHCKPGMNILRLEAPEMSVFAEIMPVYILGDFCLESKDHGFKITESRPLEKGTWQSQGAPFYGHGVVYSQSYTIEEPGGKYILSIDEWSGTVAHVRVNGSDAGVIAWRPYETDISSFIIPGSNRVEIEIIGSLHNTLGYHHSEITGWIDGPWSWNSAPEVQPPGDQYHFMDYGLSGRIRMVNRVIAE